VNHGTGFDEHFDDFWISVHASVIKSCTVEFASRVDVSTGFDKHFDDGYVTFNASVMKSSEVRFVL
jgi:hypothetical protein